MARVLVVDDNRDQLATLMALLRLEGHVTEGHHDAMKIVARVREFQPDAVVLDLAMPGKSGLEAAKEIRNAIPGKYPMLIALTGELPDEQTRALVQMNGFDYYLVKPCDPNVLTVLLARLAETG